MKIVIAGGSGFLGRSLSSAFVAEGHDVVAIGRDAFRRAPVADVDGADIVINLAGENIAAGRWTRARKAVLRRSRIDTTRALVDSIRQAARRPPVFIGGSAVGYYGASTSDTPVDEWAPPGNDFFGRLAAEWEAEARKAEGLGCRVVTIRTGIALARDGGALKKMMLPFQLFAGGPISSGRQYLSWIHRDDWVRMIVWAAANAQLTGPLNATAPNPVTNEKFSRALGRALRRPSWLRVPRLPLRILLGEMADAALVNGQRVIPRRGLDAGFEFTYPTIDSALNAIVQG